MDKEIAINYFLTYGPKFLLAVLTLLVGLFIIKIFTKLLAKSMEKSKVDETLRGFIKSVSKVVLQLLLYITVASMIGVQMTSFIAVLGAAGLAVGLALQGSLSNFAGGVLILIFRPFNVGDFIEAQGHSGIVKDIQILYTVIHTLDNKKIVIPNGNLSNNSIVNYSANDKRRVDLLFGVGYESDIKKVKEIIEKIAKNHDKILQNPAPFIRLTEHGASSINFVTRLWCNTQDYWDVYFDMTEQVKIAFDKEGINIPYPQMDVHIKNK